MNQVSKIIKDGIESKYFDIKYRPSIQLDLYKRKQYIELLKNFFVESNDFIRKKS